jgi:hypothetical protein
MSASDTHPKMAFSKKASGSLFEQTDRDRSQTTI